MSAIVESFIVCDGQDGRCKTKFGVDTRSRSVTGQREAARQNGWVYTGGKDWCPSCKHVTKKEMQEVGKNLNMSNYKKVESIAEVAAFFEGRKILIVGDHEWTGEKVDFVCIVDKNGRVCGLDEKPNLDLRARVKTRFGTELDIPSENTFIIMQELKPQKGPLN